MRYSRSGNCGTTSTYRSLRVKQWCPICKLYVGDVRFKRHISKHWVSSKRDESFNDFVRRIYEAQRSIDIETSEDAEDMRGDILPYEIPEKFAGHIIGKLRCPVCNRDFQTAVPAKDFLTSGSSKTGILTHYENDAGCGSSFSVIEVRHTRMRILVKQRDKEPYEAWVELVI